MALFRYEALDASGRVMRGAMNASNEGAVEARLREMGFTPSAVAPADSQTAAGSAGPAAGTAQGPARAVSAYVTSPLPVGDQALFWRQLAELARAGISAYDCFRSLGGRTRNGRIRRASLDVAERIRAGSSVADAMAASQDVFGTDFRMAVLAGELGGFVHDVYADLAAGLEEEKAHRERYRWYRWFNNVNLAGTLVVVHFLAVVGAYIKTHTQGLEPLSDKWYEVFKEAVAAWPAAFATKALPAAAAVLLLYWLIMRSLEYGRGRRLADAVVVSLPVAGRFKKLVLLKRFYRMLGRLLAGGVSPVVAWDAAADAIGNHRVSWQLAQGRALLSSGAGFGAAFGATGVIPYDDQQMISTAERAGRVPEMLARLEQDYGARYQSSSRLMKMAALLPAALAAGAATVAAVYMLLKGYFDFIFEYTGF